MSVLPGQAAPGASTAVELRPTIHPALPDTLERFWLVPSPTWKPATATVRLAVADLARAVPLVESTTPARAIPLIKLGSLSATPLHPYATFLKGTAEFKARLFDEARHTLAGLRAAGPPAALLERALVLEAEAAEAVGDEAGAIAAYEQLASPVLVAMDDILLRIAKAATRRGDRERAAAAWQRLYDDFAATEAGVAAAQELAKLELPVITPGPRADIEMARAERLYAARRYALAREGFERLIPAVPVDALELVTLRMAECDYFLRRARSAADLTRPLLDGASRRAEALYFHLAATRDLGDHDAYVALVRRIVTEHPASPWTEDALNGLATHYILLNDDESGDAAFRELMRLFPTGRHAARAGWKVGWWAYKHGRHAEAAEVFERSALAFPRSDYRPPWLYWSARAREQTGPAEAAVDRYRLIVTDYANSYYGRLALDRLKALNAAPPAGMGSLARWRAHPDAPVGVPATDDAAAVAGTGAVPPAVPPAVPAPAASTQAVPAPAAERLAWLIHAALYREALDEVVYAQRTSGRSAALDATRAWLLNRTGELRFGITAMRQTYPHFLASGGEALPGEILRVIFPLDHWPLIRQHAAANRLDPFLVAALVAQESTFDQEARSSANAIGLMQIVPSTGRQWARRLGIRRFSARMLTTPAINVRIGTAYFADLVRRFGGTHYALAGYNAGGHRVARWMAERPGLPREEFIDDIPFPETQNYVKRILGTAEDYRRLYGPALTAAPKPVVVPARPAAARKPAIRRR